MGFVPRSTTREGRFSWAEQEGGVDSCSETNPVAECKRNSLLGEGEGWDMNWFQEKKRAKWFKKGKNRGNANCVALVSGRVH